MTELMIIVILTLVTYVTLFLLVDYFDTRRKWKQLKLAISRLPKLHE